MQANIKLFSSEHDEAERRLYVLDGLIFGVPEIGRGHQGLKQGLVTILKGGDEQQVWRQIRSVEGYMAG